MAQEQVQQLKRQLQKVQGQFQNYKTQCKQYEQFLEKESNKKQQQIRKLKQQAIKREKNYGLIKNQVSQLETENASLKAQLSQISAQKVNATPQVDKSEQYIKQIQQLKKKNQQLFSECQQHKNKVQAIQKKLDQQSKSVSKGKQTGDTKKLEEALAGSKSKINQLQKQVQRLKQQLSKKNSIKQSKSQQKRVQKQHKDNKQQQRLRQKIQKLQRKIKQSQSQTDKSQQVNIRLSKQVKQLKSKVSSIEAQKQNLNKKIKDLMSSSIKKKEQKAMKQQNEDEQQIIEQHRQVTTFNNLSNIFSALILTKKHYISPFLQLKNDNSIKIFKNTKNGSFQKSLGAIKYKLNEINYSSEQILQNCAKTIFEDFNNGIKSSIIIFGAKKTTKKYLLANLVTKIKDFVLQKISQSAQQLEATFISASPNPDKRIEMHGHNKEQFEQIVNKIVDNAQKSPKKNQNLKSKVQPKPKARYFKIAQGQLFIQIITTSFTNFQLRENLSPTEALNNIAYSRLPNALQPTDCHRQVILTLNPIVSLYDQCKNTLSITNCKNTGQTQSSQFEMRNSGIKEELLNDTARKKLENVERQSEQYLLKVRKQQQDIQYYKSKFDELQLRLKNLLNTHRQQNSYLKKSPVTLSYEKMLKFVHSVQAKNPSTPSNHNHAEEVSKVHENEQIDDYQLNEQNYHQQGQGEDIL